MGTDSGRLGGVDAGLQAGLFYRALEALGVKELVLRRGLANLPRGAIRFPALIMRGGKYTQDEVRSEIAAVRDRLGVADMMIVIGAAFEVAGSSVLLVGPPGIGKSTAVADLSRRHSVRVLDDDCVLVGLDRAGETAYAIETGAYSREKEYVQRQLRTLMRHRSACLVPVSDDPAARARRLRAARRADRVALWSAAGSIVLVSLDPRPARRDFVPVKVPITHVIYCLGRRDPVPPILFPADGMPRPSSASEIKQVLGSASITQLGLPDPTIRDKLKALLESVASDLERGSR